MHGRALLMAACAMGALIACRDVLHMSAHAERAAAEAPESGVPLTLAQERAARLSDLRYDLHFEIPAAVEAPARGAATIRFRLTDASRPLALDFAGPAAAVVRVGGADVDAPLVNEHIILPASALRAGENEIAVAFEAGNLPLNRSREFMYTLFVPARARLAFPCFDQPDLKGRFRLTLDVPEGWEGIGNGAIQSRAVAAFGTRLVFEETAPIPTYLLAFAAGAFTAETAVRNGRSFRMLHRETDAEKVARNRDAIFDLHASALAWLEEYTGIPYPFGKFEFLLVPSFQFGGMEHPGAIFYNAAALLLDLSATQNQHLNRAGLIAHETAHMWFGDLVTMRWFDDVWMKEVFANFMAAKIVNPSFPGIDHDLRFLYAHYPAAYDVDRTQGTNAIRQPLDNLREAGSLYGAIIYQKAPIVMRQLEMIVTPDGLRNGLRDYLRRYAFGNASWPDLIRLLDGRTPDDLAAWSRAWVEEAGRPTVTTTRVHRDEGAVAVTLSQEDPLPGRSLAWAQRLLLTAGFTTGLRNLELPLVGSEAQGQLTAAPGSDLLFVLPTGGGIGYGDFVLDERSRAYLTTSLHAIGHPLTRGAAVVTLSEEMLGGRARPEILFDVLLRAVGSEDSELNVQRMLTGIQQIWWKFLPDHQRRERAPHLERALRAGLDAAPGASLKAAWFGALRNTALTADTVAWLTGVWAGTIRVEGLTLAEPDFMTLALELAVREAAGWDAILAQQRDRIRNPDRRDQFAFVVPAVSADIARRATFIEGLRDLQNRRREAWVLQAVAYLHHPLRAAESERHIETALDLLTEIQRTGDIFFPKRWMDATLSGHQSAGAARRVARFLDALPPGYPDHLRRVILSSADLLFRASSVRTAQANGER